MSTMCVCVCDSEWFGIFSKIPQDVPRNSKWNWRLLLSKYGNWLAMDDDDASPIPYNLWHIWFVPTTTKTERRCLNCEKDSKMALIRIFEYVLFTQKKNYICVLIENIFLIINHFSWIFERVGDKQIKKRRSAWGRCKKEKRKKKTPSRRFEKRKTKIISFTTERRRRLIKHSI